MAPIKLQTESLSYNSIRPQLVLEEKGLAWERVPASLSTFSHKTEEFIKISPFGNIPVLYLEDGTTMYESRAIGRVLAQIHKGLEPKLMIEPDEKGYVQYEEALAVEAFKFDPYATSLVFHKLIAGYVMIL
jgi:glutathione S-transferase